MTPDNHNIYCNNQIKAMIVQECQVDTKIITVSQTITSIIDSHHFDKSAQGESNIDHNHILMA